MRNDKDEITIGTEKNFNKLQEITLQTSVQVY